MRLPQTIRFCIAGAPGITLYAIVYLGITRLLVQDARDWYIEATIIASIASWGTTFYFQRNWTFRNKEDGWLRQANLYAAKVLLFIFLLGPFLIYMQVHHFGIFDLWAQIYAMVAITIVSYLIDRWIFARQETAASLP